MSESKVIVGVFATAVMMLSGCSGKQGEVRQYGRMHDVLGGGPAAANAQVSVKEILSRPNAIGVGALEGLQGEITIYDGHAWVARPAAGKLVVDGPMAASSEQAALMTAAHVDKWCEATIDEDTGGSALETLIARRAEEKGIAISQPFPFVIEGEVTDMQMHVINGACPMKPGAIAMPEQQPWRHVVAGPTRVTIVGFYARDSVGKLTHPGTSIHAHALVMDGEQTLTGHVERIAVTSGARLRVPEVW